MVRLQNVHYFVKVVKNVQKLQFIVKLHCAQYSVSK